MRRTFDLVSFPRRRVLFRLLPPLLLTYGVLLPCQLSLFPAEDRYTAACTFYTLAQVFLLIAALWPQFLYFLPLCHEDSRELIRALRHPDGTCALLLWGEHQLRTLPLYVIYLTVLPEERFMVVLLVVQSLCAVLGFLLLTTLLRSAVVGMVMPLAYGFLCVMSSDVSLPVLLQKNRLWETLPAEYFPVRLILAAAMLLVLRRCRHCLSPAR